MKVEHFEASAAFGPGKNQRNWPRVVLTFHSPVTRGGDGALEIDSGKQLQCYITLNHDMADETPIAYSYSPSGSTIELIDLARTRPSTRLSSRVSSAGSSLSWHPKLTLYRLLVILSTVGLTAAKTATSYLNLAFASITLEWILGVVVFLL